MNAYVIMRNDVEIGYTTDEPICVMLEDTYESRYKAMKQYFGVEQLSERVLGSDSTDFMNNLRKEGTMRPLSEEELQMAAENDWATFEYEEGNLYRVSFFGGYKLGYAKCLKQMQAEFNELLKACHTSLRNQTKVDINEIINQMKGGNDE